jgi:hypothetical protein
MERKQLKKNSFKIFSSEELSNKRYNICKTCSNFKFGFCKKCGCLMVAKTKLLSATCPVDKWEDKYHKEEW